MHAEEVRPLPPLQLALQGCFTPCAFVSGHIYLKVIVGRYAYNLMGALACQRGLPWRLGCVSVSMYCVQSTS